MLNCSEVQVFVVAAETENFSETARRLHLSQPAVSQRIHSLERELGLRLFQRSGRSVRLTSADRVLLPMARQLMDMIRQIAETIWSLEDEITGHIIIIGCTTTAGKYALPLLGQPFILREEGCSSCQMIDASLKNNGITIDQLHVVMSVGNSEAIEMAVEHGLGIAFISRLAASRGLESGRVVEVPVEGIHQERPLYVVRNASAAKAPAERRLWDFVAEHRKRIFHMLDA